MHTVIAERDAPFPWPVLAVCVMGFPFILVIFVVALLIFLFRPHLFEAVVDVSAPRP